VALKVVTMAEMRLEVLLEAERTGMSVTEVCRRYGISRQTYYRYRSRYLAEGLEGLDDRSRRPLVPAHQIPADLEAQIVEMRKEHPRSGARRIRSELVRAGIDPPVVSTIHQVLRRNGLVAATKKRKFVARHDACRSSLRPSRDGILTADQERDQERAPRQHRIRAPQREEPSHCKGSLRRAGRI